MRIALIAAGTLTATALLLQFTSYSDFSKASIPNRPDSMKIIQPKRMRADVAVYKDSSAPLESRVDDLFSRLSQDDKLSLLSGTGFTTQPLADLGVPPMGMVDAGQGVRGGIHANEGPATAFPTEVVMAQSWDRDLIRQVGQAIGEEAQNKGEGAQILLGPDVNIHRSPLGGRDAESFTEDPYLNAQMAVSYITGMQNSGTISCIKHYACNNEEVDRNTVDARVDERALREIYLPAFKAGVQQGHAHAVMASYNKINGYYATANHYLLTDVLKNDWGFDGIVMSDWGAVHETAGAITAGTDLEMPGGDWMTPDKVAPALAAGDVTQAQIDGAARRILRTIVRAGLLDGPRPAPNPNMVDSPAHQDIAYNMAAGGIVLLRNEGGALPIDRSAVRSVAVIGEPAVHVQVGALGSPAVEPAHLVDPLDGIKAAAGSVKIDYAAGMTLPQGNPDTIPTEALTTPSGDHGLLGEYFTTPDLTGTAVPRVDAQVRFRNGTGPQQISAQVHSARWTGKLTAANPGDYNLVLIAHVACRLIIDGKAVVDVQTPGDEWFHSAKLKFAAGSTHDIEVDVLGLDGHVRAGLLWQAPGVDSIGDAAAAASKADAAVVFVSMNGDDGEGRDRPSMDLPANQEKLINAVAAVNKRTIVVLNCGAPVSTQRWIGNVSAVLDAGYPGQEGGRAIAAILFGDVNPSGRLTDTYGARHEDYSDFGNFPGTNGTVHYADGIYVGYRYYDKNKIKPVFPFGYGLSYTTFALSDLRLSSAAIAANGFVDATFTVTNTGTKEGKDVVELYVHDPHPTVDRPIRELKGFAKVDLAPGQSKRVTLTVTPQAFAYYDVNAKQWSAHPGTYEIEVGHSSRDLPLTREVKLTSPYGQPD